MQKIDLRKQLKPLYGPSARAVQVIEVPCMNFLAIDGMIEPGLKPGTSPSFQAAVGAMYGAAYTLKFMSKLREQDPVDYPVMALEGLWWVEDGEFSFTGTDPWSYTLMILQPDFITPSLFAEALRQMRQKKGDQPAFSQLRLEAFEEGLCIQILHVGPYAGEPATIEKMDAFAQEKGLKMRGKHHEIYLGDPMRAQPEKLKTILRHPVSA